MSLRRVNAAWLLLAWLALAGVPVVGQVQTSPVLVSPGSFPPGPPAPVPDDSVTPFTVQITPPRISISSTMLGVAGPLGARAATGKPIAAEFVTVHDQIFTDGNRISRSTVSVIYRDGVGRIRRESQLSLPGLPASVAATFITIVDHRLGYGWVLDPQEMLAHRYELNGPGPSYMASLSAQGSGSGLLSPDSKAAAASAANTASPANAPDNSRWRLHTPRRLDASPDSTASPGAMSSGVASGQLGSSILPEETGFANAPAMRLDQPFLAAPNPVRTENLGEERILGFRVHGTRIVTTLPAGEIGNDRPIDIVSEQWYSPDLELVMRNMHRDPWAGEFTTTVTKISRGEQPAWRFQIPAQYKIVDDADDAGHQVLDNRGSRAPGTAPW
jgi:hypothetical protein